MPLLHRADGLEDCDVLQPHEHALRETVPQHAVDDGRLRAVGSRVGPEGVVQLVVVEHDLVVHELDPQLLAAVDHAMDLRVGQIQRLLSVVHEERDRPAAAELAAGRAAWVEQVAVARRAGRRRPVGGRDLLEVEDLDPATGIDSARVDVRDVRRLPRVWVVRLVDPAPRRAPRDESTDGNRRREDGRKDHCDPEDPQHHLGEEANDIVPHVKHLLSPRRDRG